MKFVPRPTFIGFCLVGALLLETASIYLASDAYAVYGVRRRTARRTAVVVGSAASAQTAQAQQEAAAANARADAAEQEAAAAEAEAAAAQAAPAPQPASATGALPLGTVATTLPGGCNKTVIGGVEYYYDGVNYYRAAFQGSQLVYVTSQP